MLARVRSLARMVLRRSQWEQDMREELNLHIQLRAEHLGRSGLPRGEAMRHARLEFGGPIDAERPRLHVGGCAVTRARHRREHCDL